MPTIDKPTRVHNSSATLIDNIRLTKMMLISLVAILSRISLTIFRSFVFPHFLSKPEVEKTNAQGFFFGFSFNGFNSELSDALSSQAQARRDGERDWCVRTPLHATEVHFFC